MAFSYPQPTGSLLCVSLHLSSPSQCTATTPSHLWLRPRNDFSEILPPLPMSQQQRTCRVLPLSPRPSLSNPICLDYEFQCAFSEASPDSQELETQRRTALRSVLPAGKGVHTDTPWRPSTEGHLRLDSENRGAAGQLQAREASIFPQDDSAKHEFSGLCPLLQKSIW